MRALVTGGAGLIGSHIADLLYSEGYKVRILDNLDPETHPKKPDWVSKNYEFIKGDIRDKQVLEKALTGVDFVFHEAAYGGFTSELTKYFDVNSIGTAKLFEVIKDKKLKVKKIIVASSQAIYGEGKYSCKTHGVMESELRLLSQLERKHWEIKCPVCENNLVPVATDENKKLDPGTIYAITKFTEEQMVIKLGQNFGIPTVALRYAVTYGPRQSIFNPYTGVISIFSTRILNNLPPVIYEDGNQTRDFINVEDVARANFLVSQNDKANYQVFNVSTGIQTRVLDLVSLLNKTYGTNVKPVLNGEFRLGEVRHLFLDNTKLKKLGWKPEVKLEDGVKMYVDWIKTQGDIKEFWDKAYKMMKENRVVLQAKK